jgi:hypothetical protein
MEATMVRSRRYADRLASALAAAVPVEGSPCDTPDCPAWAMRRVEIFDQDFYFCSHHWYEQLQRLPVGS